MKKKYILGFILLTILASGVLLQFNDNVRIRVTNDFTRFYVPHDDYPWIWVIGGTEENRLFDGNSIMNRRKSGIQLDTIFDNQSNEITIIRTTPYIRGPIIRDTYKFDGDINDVKLFPISHQVEIFNATGFFYRYTLNDLTNTGLKRKLTDETLLSFGRNMKVELNQDYRWAWIGWPYGSDSLSAQYDINSDYQVFNVRLFDPPIINLTIANGETFILGGDNDTYDTVWVQIGGTLEVNSTIGYLNLIANNITIDGSILGDGKSNFTGGTAGSGGCSPNCQSGQTGGSGQGGSGGSGGTGGIGGHGNGCSSPGGSASGGSGASQAGTETGRMDFSQGRAGGGGGGGQGGNDCCCYRPGQEGKAGKSGGAGLRLYSDYIKVSGSINVNGGNGGVGGWASQDDSPCDSGGGGGGGGGSGGTILIDGNNVNLDNAYLTVRGGSGGTGGGKRFGGAVGQNGASGKGGRIKIFYQTLSKISISTTLGSSGTIYYATVPISYAILSSPNNLTTANITAFCNGTVETGEIAYYWDLFEDDVLFQSGFTGNVTSGESQNIYNVTNDLLSHNQTWKLDCIATDYIYNSTATTSLQINQPIVINIISPEDNSFIGEVPWPINYTYANFTSPGVCWWTNSSGDVNNSITCGENITGQIWQEGINQITIFGNDTDNSIFNDTVNFVVDTETPLIEYADDTYNFFGWLNFNNITIEVNILDNSLQNVTYKLRNLTDLVNTTVLSSSQPKQLTFYNLPDTNYTINVTAVDFFNRENTTANREFYVDTIFPLITFEADSDITNTTGNFTNKDNIYVNVSVTELNGANITFTLWSSSFGVVNETIFTDNTREINWTDLAEDMYFWNVTIADLASNKNNTETRKYGISYSNLTIEDSTENQTVELGSNVSVFGIFSNGTVCLDIDHPSFGVNYTCQEITLNKSIKINNFRKINFSDLNIDKNVSFKPLFSINNTLLEISSHQYVIIDNLSINMSSIGGLPKNITFYIVNTTSIDRNYQGFLLGDNIFLNHTFDELFSQTIADSFGGIDRFVYFYLDNNIGLNYNFSFNITGYEFGNNYFDNFDNYSGIDISQTTAQLDSGVIMPNVTNKLEFTFDEFDDGDVTVGGRWIKTDDFSQDVGFCELRDSVSETGGYMLLHSSVSNSHNHCSAATLTPVSQTNNSKINLHTSDYITFNISATYSSDADNTGCAANSYVNSGNNQIWSSMYLNDDGDGDDFEGSQADLIFNLTKYNTTTWRGKIRGIETSSVIRSGGSCLRTNNWTGGIYTQVGSGCSGGDGVLDNDFLFGVDYSHPSIMFNTVSQVQNSECEHINTDMKVYFVNNTLWKRNNGTVVSDIVYSSDTDSITRATFSADLFSYSFQENQSATYFLSVDNGTTWEPITNGLEYQFSIPGSILRWRTDFNLTGNENSYLNDSIWLDNVNITIPTGSPSNITIDWGDDGIIDQTLPGIINSTNSPVTINLSGINLTDSFINATQIYPNLFKIPLVIKSATIGSLKVDNINITYNPNPIILNSTSIENFLYTYGKNKTNFTIPIGASGGDINITDLRYDYAGGNHTYKFLVHNPEYTFNSTIFLDYFFSMWDFEIVPRFVDFIEFIPTSSTSKNVTPFGQTTSIPILNITNYGYGGKDADLFVYMNDTFSCINVTLSTTNNKGDGFQINQSWLSVSTDVPYLNQTKLWMWADYSCTSNNNWSLFNPSFYFRECASGSICSEELI